MHETQYLQSILKLKINFLKTHLFFYCVCFGLQAVCSGTRATTFDSKSATLQFQCGGGEYNNIIPLKRLYIIKVPLLQMFRCSIVLPIEHMKRPRHINLCILPHHELSFSDYLVSRISNLEIKTCPKYLSKHITFLCI